MGQGKPRACASVFQRARRCTAPFTCETVQIPCHYYCCFWYHVTYLANIDSVSALQLPRFLELTVQICFTSGTGT